MSMLKTNFQHILVCTSFKARNGDGYITIQEIDT